MKVNIANPNGRFKLKHITPLKLEENFSLYIYIYIWELINDKP
jgi:hypothetical protein